jgi:hypothetical protein
MNSISSALSVPGSSSRLTGLRSIGGSESMSNLQRNSQKALSRLKMSTMAKTEGVLSVDASKNGSEREKKPFKYQVVNKNPEAQGKIRLALQVA